jgi:4a-hydroxytetrahydrobiopterin dehydratase
MARLNETDLAAGLSTLGGWASANDEISKTYTFGDFVAAIAFVNRVADLAEAAGHHPDIDIRYNRVRIGLTTHDQGGITDHDLSLARQIETVA